MGQARVLAVSAGDNRNFDRWSCADPFACQSSAPDDSASPAKPAGAGENVVDERDRLFQDIALQTFVDKHQCRIDIPGVVLLLLPTPADSGGATDKAPHNQAASQPGCHFPAGGMLYVSQCLR